MNKWRTQIVVASEADLNSSSNIPRHAIEGDAIELKIGILVITFDLLHHVLFSLRVLSNSPMLDLWWRQRRVGG